MAAEDTVKDRLPKDDDTELEPSDSSLRRLFEKDAKNSDTIGKTFSKHCCSSREEDPVPLPTVKAQSEPPCILSSSQSEQSLDRDRNHQEAAAALNRGQISSIGSTLLKDVPDICCSEDSPCCSGSNESVLELYLYSAAFPQPGKHHPPKSGVGAFQRPACSSLNTPKNLASERFPKYVPNTGHGTDGDGVSGVSQRQSSRFATFQYRPSFLRSSSSEVNLKNIFKLKGQSCASLNSVGKSTVQSSSCNAASPGKENLKARGSSERALITASCASLTVFNSSDHREICSARQSPDRGVPDTSNLSSSASSSTSTVQTVRSVYDLSSSSYSAKDCRTRSFSASSSTNCENDLTSALTSGHSVRRGSCTTLSPLKSFEKRGNSSRQISKSLLDIPNNPSLHTTRIPLTSDKSFSSSSDLLSTTGEQNLIKRSSAKTQQPDEQSTSADHIHHHHQPSQSDRYRPDDSFRPVATSLPSVEADTPNSQSKLGGTGDDKSISQLPSSELSSVTISKSPQPLLHDVKELKNADLDDHISFFFIKSHSDDDKDSAKTTVATDNSDPTVCQTTESTPGDEDDEKISSGADQEGRHFSDSSQGAQSLTLPSPDSIPTSTSKEGCDSESQQSQRLGEEESSSDSGPESAAAEVVVAVVDKRKEAIAPVESSCAEGSVVAPPACKEFVARECEDCRPKVLLHSSSVERPRLLPSKRRTSDVGRLADTFLSRLYEPFDSVRLCITRQSRDVLSCRFFGDARHFGQHFLKPTAELLGTLKAKEGKASIDCHSCCAAKWKGWPLCFNRRVVVHLSELDSAVLKPGDFYFLVSFDPGTSTDDREDLDESSDDCSCSVNLAVRYRCENGSVGQRAINEQELGRLFTMDWLYQGPGPTGSDSDDNHLMSVLKHLLVSVERGVERIEWDSVVGKPWKCGHVFSSRCCGHATSGVQGASSAGSSTNTSPVDTRDSCVQANLTDEDDDDKDACGSSAGSSKMDDWSRRTSASSGMDPGTSFVDSDAEGVDRSRENSLTGGVLPIESLASLFRQHRHASREEEQDDGYYDNTLAQPTCMSQLDQDVIRSKIACIPGCRDSTGRSVVIIYSTAFKEHSGVTPSQLAELLMYFHTVPKKDIIVRGFLILVETTDASEEFWLTLDEAFSLLEANISNAVNSVVLWNSGKDLQSHENLFPNSRIKTEFANSEENLLKVIKKDQLLVDFGGTYVYDHQEWMSFRKFLEPFMNGCRLSGRHLVNVMQELRTSRVPPSASLTRQMIEQQKRHINLTFQDEQLRHLQEEGETILKELESYKSRSPHNQDYRDVLEKSCTLYSELKRAMNKLSKLADKRLQRLQECLQLRTYEEESSQVISWLCKKGDDALNKHQFVADSLSAIKDQEHEFEKFYFLAMRHIEKGNDLLEEAGMMPAPNAGASKGSGPHELASSLRHHLDSFTERLEDTREKLEDTSKCYHLLDRCYEWALEAMKFVSSMKMDNTTSAENLGNLIKMLNDYLEDHPIMPPESFDEMINLATKLGNPRLLEQCKTAQTRCQETIDLIHARQATLAKAQHQLELDSKILNSPNGWGDCDGRAIQQGFAPCWSPQSTSTPYCSFVRRRSIATTSPHLYTTSISSYTAFPSNYVNSNLRDSLALEQYMQEKEDQLLNQGLITDDLTRQGPVASISRSFLESRTKDVSHTSGNKLNLSSLKDKVKGSLHYRPQKKFMRRSYTWQLCEEALQKATAQVKEQNERLKVEKLANDQDTTSSSDEFTSSTQESDDLCSPEEAPKSQTTSPCSETGQGPVPVNSHLLTRASTLQLADAAVSDANLSEEQLKNKKTLLLIMREMIQTERDYVRSLEYIIDHYIPELLREDIPQALRGQRNVIFGNIEKIFEFHSQYFLQELEQCENSPFLVGQCFLKYEPQFYLYALYNKNKPKSDTLMSEYGTPFFKKMQLELGDKMDLASYLLKPVQRMGKYALLLKQLLKECPEREPEHLDLRAAEEMVKFQLRHGNDLLAMDALRDCDVNVKEQGRLLRQDEFLVWQGRSRKSLRHVFLFEELILFSKVRRDPEHKGHEIYQYKHSIKTSDIGMTEQIGESPTKFEIWFRKRKLNDVYLLQAPNPEVRTAWIHEISKLLWKQALRNREMRLAEMSSMGIGNKPCLDIKPSEDQISDRSISLLQLNRTPKFRSSVAMGTFEQLRNNKRPHSIISVSSSSSSGSSQSSFFCALNLGFEGGDSPRPLHRSHTQQSQCSTESGFCTDASLVGDIPVEAEQSNRHKKAERSDSLLSNESLATHLEISALPEEQIGEEVTSFRTGGFCMQDP